MSESQANAEESSVEESSVEESNDHISESKEETKPARIPDIERFYKVGKVHGLALLAAITLWGAADTWVAQSGLLLASFLSVINALVAATILATIFHEWGHFLGARMSGSYSPMVTDPYNQFIFGFNFTKNTRQQFLAMSFGGPIGNWILVALVVLMVPLDNAGRIMLFAVVVARAISVCLFEIPIIMKTMSGGEPEQELSDATSAGSLNRSRNIGYGIGALIFIVAL
jgi:hypothetical protein